MVYLVGIGILIALTFGLIGAGAALGFATAIYFFRHELCFELIAIISPSHAQSTNVTTIKIGLGIGISIFIPVVAALSYSLSGAAWLVEIFGPVGQWLWGWVAGAYLLGLIVGSLYRHPRTPTIT